MHLCQYVSLQNRPFNIAIDGPAGAGKSTIAKHVAAELGFLYVDTGALYRTLALGVLRAGADPTDETGVEAVLPALSVRLSHEADGQHVHLDGEDVTGLIRTEEIGNAASAIAAFPAVRQKLLSLQRDAAASFDLVMDGRDIGTAILPDAQVKIFLAADPAVRARRRCLEYEEAGKSFDFDQVLSDILERDERDRTRAVAPLAKAEDAAEIDSSDMTIDEVCAAVLALTEAARGRK